MSSHQPKKGREREEKKECYYPNCEKEGDRQYGYKSKWFGLCEEHYNLVVFMRDIFDFFFENR